MKLERATFLDFSPDDTKVVSYDDQNGKIQIWQTNDGKKLKVIKTKNKYYDHNMYDSELLPIKFTPDGSKIASIGGETDNII